MYDGSGSYRSSYLSVSAGRPGLSMPAVGGFIEWLGACVAFTADRLYLKTTVSLSETSRSANAKRRTAQQPTPAAAA
jgi:hypothetical protein